MAYSGGVGPEPTPMAAPVAGTKILLKRSGVKGKLPVADDAEYGELFINYHSGDPMLCFKDNAGEIVEIKPARSIDGGGGELPPDTGNSVGDTIWDGSFLLVWDGADWQKVGPNDLAYVQKVDGGTITNSAGDDVDLPLATVTYAGLIVDAASDGKQYARVNGAWAEVDIPPGTTVSEFAPGGPQTGQLWYGTTSGELKVYDGATWQVSKVDLAYTAAADKGTVTCSVGNNAELPLVSSSQAGLMSPGDKNKLDTYPADSSDLDIDLQVVTDNGNTTDNIIDAGAGVRINGGNAATIDNGITKRIFNSKDVLQFSANGELKMSLNLDGDAVRFAASTVNAGTESTTVAIRSNIAGTHTNHQSLLVRPSPASSSSIDNLYGLVVQPRDKGTATIANNYGCWVGSASGVGFATIGSVANIGYYSDVANPAGSENYNFYATGVAPNFLQGSAYIGGNTTRNTRELWESLLTDEQKEELAAGTLAIPANVSTPGDGSFIRQWWYDQQSTEDQALIDSGELAYPEKLQPANFTDSFVLGDNTSINLNSDGSADFSAKNIRLQTNGIIQSKGLNTDGSVSINRLVSGSDAITITNGGDPFKFRVKADGNTQIGGDVAGDDPNITLSADGDATFTGNVTTPEVVLDKTNNYGAYGRVYLNSGGANDFGVQLKHNSNSTVYDAGVFLGGTNVNQAGRIRFYTSRNPGTDDAIHTACFESNGSFTIGGEPATGWNPSIAMNAAGTVTAVDFKYTGGSAPSPALAGKEINLVKTIELMAAKLAELGGVDVASLFVAEDPAPVTQPADSADDAYA